MKMSRSWAAGFGFKRGKIIQVEGTACVKAQNFERMGPWNFMELVVNLVLSRTNDNRDHFINYTYLKIMTQLSHSDVEII